MGDRFLLDTSAVLALTDREEGAETVEALLERAASAECAIEICAASLMELYYISLQEGSEDEAARLVAAVKSWPVTWIYPDEKALMLAGRIKAYQRLSFADALIAAVAKLRGATLVHKDPELNALAGELPLLRLPYKRQRS